jgi:hypothetical protein
VAASVRKVIAGVSAAAYQQRNVAVMAGAIFEAASMAAAIMALANQSSVMASWRIGISSIECNKLCGGMAAANAGESLKAKNGVIMHGGENMLMNQRAKENGSKMKKISIMKANENEIAAMKSILAAAKISIS